MPVTVSAVGGGLEAGDLDVLEAVEREPGRPGLLALARADVGVDAAGLAEVGRVDRAVGVEPLGEPEGDLLARLARDLEPGHAGEVLAHVEHVDARLRLRDRFGPRARRMARTGGPGWAWTSGLISAPTTTGVPAGVVEARRVPAVQGQPRVVGFAHEEVGLEDRAELSPSSPGRWRRSSRAAVGVLDVELGQEPRVLAVVVALLAEADVAAVPAVGQDRPRGRCPRTGRGRSRRRPGSRRRLV